MTLDEALGGMRDIPQWFAWRLEWLPDEQKYKKTPWRDGRAVDASQSVNWLGYDAARAELARLNTHATVQLRYALGFWLTADCGYWFFDLDKCASAPGVLLPYAQQLAEFYAGTLQEWSSSGNGVHIIGRADNIPLHRNKPERDVAARALPMQLEFYSRDRGICFGLSGDATGCADTLCDVAPLLAQMFPPRVERDSGRRPEWRGPEDDDELLRRAQSARVSAQAAFGGKVSFTDLFNGKCEQSSENDMALASHLAWWTGSDEPRIERIMRRSRLQRAKWNDRRPGGTYLTHTIERACAMVDGCYQEPAPLPTPPPVDVNVRSGAALMQRAFAPVQWALRDLIPQGTGIISAPPKSGKSWLVLQACIAVAAGVPLWPGREPETKGDTLYLDLEGTDRRLQERIGGLLKSFPRDTSLNQFFYETEWPRAEAGVAKLREWLTEHPDTRLVVIDTLATFRDPDPGRKSAYMADYAVGEMLKPLVREFPVAVVVVTHNRKMGATDAMDKISGTQGLVGGVDNYMILSRASGNMDAELIVDGRDIKNPQELALRKLKDGGWACVGTSYEVKRSDERTNVLKALAGLGGVGTRSDITGALDGSVKPETLRKRLGRMVKDGDIVLNGKLYTLVSKAAPELTPPPTPGRGFPL